MAAVPPLALRRGTQRASHLSKVSNGSSDIIFNSRPLTAESDSGTVQHGPVPPKPPVEKSCWLLIHDEAFSKEEVLINLDLFPEVKVGELLAIVALKADSVVRDFQDKAQASRKDVDTLATAMQRERSNSNPRSPGPPNDKNAKKDVDLGQRCLFIAKDMSKEMKERSLELSVAKHIADLFCLKNRSNVLITTVDAATNSASHVELSFKDEYLARSDMWRLAVGELGDKTVFKGQKILFMGTIKAQVTAVYVNGSKVQSAFFSTNTKPIFRSESARYVLFIQMSREMWDFDSEGSGEIMFNKVVNGFLPALFKKWASLKAKHLVSIVLFTRVEYDTGITSELGASAHDTDYHTGIQADGNKKPYKDFYRVVVSEMASGSWTTILYQLKREFKFFRKDISLHRIETISVNAQSPPHNDMRGAALGTRIEAEPSLAMYGNVLEAINLASSQFAHDYIDRDLMRTGISIVVITPGPGLFEVDYETLRVTTETLIGNGIGIDLVCLPKMPLHSVPLFRYRNPQFAAFHEALHYKALRSEDSTPRQNAPIFGSSFSSLNESLSPSKASQPERAIRSGSFVSLAPPTEWSYAIPHWIDVSFWTGASKDVGLANASTKFASKRLKKMASRRKADFPVRCKMYEMEMASVIDNVMTEIAVTPLQHDALFPQMLFELHNGPNRKKSGEGNPETIQHKKVFGSLGEFVNGSSKSLLDRNSTQEDKRFYHALDTFDTTASEVLENHPSIRLNQDGKRYFKTGSEEAAKKVLAEDPKVFGTSFNDDAALKGAIFLSGPGSGKTKQETKNTDDKSRKRKDSVASSMTANSGISPVRPPKMGRQISLGKHGFGIAAPKAATVEIQTEHASAAKPLSVNKRPQSTSGTGMVTNHLLTPATSQTLERPTSANSEKSKKRVETPPEAKISTDSANPEKNPSTRPMTIKSALQSLDSTNQFKSRSVLGSLYEITDDKIGGDGPHSLHSRREDDTQKLYHSKLLAGAVPELPSTLSPTTALSPWLSVLNPSNPSANDVLGPSQYRRWQHMFPKPLLANTMKWKSLCSPASVPLTTEFFPSKTQLDSEYQQKPYKISQNVDDDLSEVPRSREDFLRDLISLRLSQGFQIVVGPAVAQAFGQKSLKIANVFERDSKTDDGTSVFMSMGNTIHQLSCVNDSEIEVNMFIRKPTASTALSHGSVSLATYNPAIRTTLAEDYQSRLIDLAKPRDDYNWNYVDAYIAGFDEKMTENLRFWRARFVLIPVERPTQSQRRQGEDNEEEIRLEGIKKLTQMWQKHRIVSASEKRFQSLASRKTKDPNPLDIVYKTDDPSIVVTAELETLPLLETGEAGPRRGQLLETERFRKAKLDIASLAEAIQSPVEKGGVRMQNRRWHFRLHYNCFIGSDMTTWLIENFEDIETREEAVELGNFLMAKDELQKIKEKENGKEKDKDMGIFVHVEKRHPFRDGQYFYQVTGEYAKQRPESRSGWFASRRRDNSVPSTPMSDSVMRDSPRPERSRSSSDDVSSDSGDTSTPTTGGAKRPKVALSKVMKYDVDHRKRSYRPERINLHYDRLHNPDNCYHIRIDWMNVTAKLIEDAIESWAMTAERYGLRLVEAPIGEACSITTVHPFRSPYIIELTCQPPDQQPRTYFDVNSFGPQVQTSPASRHYYQKAIMKKFNFVLDIEAAKNFPRNVDVTYSWGKPNFKYTQYIHRSGVLLAQITDEGNFLLLANRLYNNRTAVARDSDRYVKPEHVERNNRMASSAVYAHNIPDKPTPLNSPMLRPTNTSAIFATTNQLPPNSPLLRATSDVLGHGLSGSKVANAITPETIKRELEAFCQDSAGLEVFYKEVFEKATPPSATPPNLRSPYVSGLLDSNIPTLGLPPGVLARDTSPSPMRLSNMPGVGSSMPQLGRRPSVQIGGTSYVVAPPAQGGDSPRGSVAEGEKLPYETSTF